MFALCSWYGTIKAESFEKEVLMLSSTERVFPWNKYFDHLKNFILLATDSVSMQAFFFCIFFLHFFPKKNIYRTKVAFKRIFDLHSSFFKSIIFLSQQFTQMKSFQIWNIPFFSVPVNIVGGWLFLLFKKFNQNEKINVNLYLHPSYWSLEKFYGRHKSLH